MMSLILLLRQIRTSKWKMEGLTAFGLRSLCLRQVVLSPSSAGSALLY